MDPKRKRLYIILIIVCVVLSAGVLLWDKLGSSSSTSEPAFDLAVTPAATKSTAPEAAIKKNSNGVYPAPAVFPANKILDISVLDFSAFKVFSPYQPATISPGELGRDDPFKKY
jgi:hypothetical protein